MGFQMEKQKFVLLQDKWYKKSQVFKNMVSIVYLKILKTRF